MVGSVFNIHFGEIALIPSAYFGQCSAHMATTTHSIECNVTHSCCTLILCPHPIDYFKKTICILLNAKNVIIQNSRGKYKEKFIEIICSCISVSKVYKLYRDKINRSTWNRNVLNLFEFGCSFKSVANCIRFHDKMSSFGFNLFVSFFQLKRISIMSILDSMAPTFFSQKRTNGNHKNMIFS